MKPQRGTMRSQYIQKFASIDVKKPRKLGILKKPQG